MINVPISIGELIDKLSILEIKKNKVESVEKLLHIKKEHTLLMELSKPFLTDEKIFDLYCKLIYINSKLWDIEDKIRDFESKKKFDDEFIKLGREVYFTNDERFFLKNQINELTNSTIKEIKNYKEYK